MVGFIDEHRAAYGGRADLRSSADRSVDERGSHYLFIRSLEGLAEAGVHASIGVVGRRDEHALAESVNAIYKTELIRRHGLWKSIESLELAILDYVRECRTARPHSALGHVPPCEYERLHPPRHAASSRAA